MTYTVVWSLAAIQQLGAVAASAGDPPGVRQAAAFVEYALRRMPRDVGESRSGNARIWYEGTLGVYFTVDDVQFRVEILLVGPARRH